MENRMTAKKKEALFHKGDFDSNKTFFWIKCCSSLRLGALREHSHK